MRLPRKVGVGHLNICRRLWALARVSVLGGVGEIGGNKILVEDKDARVMWTLGCR